jgi:hypothetical protein
MAAVHVLNAFPMGVQGREGAPFRLWIGPLDDCLSVSTVGNLVRGRGQL